MTKSVTVHATPGTRNQWSTNQKVRVSAKTSDCLVVTSDQNRSTPGLYTRLYLKQNTQYTVEVKGCSYHAQAFVWVFDPKTCKRLIPNYTFLPSTRGCVCADFCTPESANEYVCLYVGALFTGPPTKGQQFELCRVTISCAKGGSKKPVPASKPATPCHYPPAPCAPHAAPHPHPHHPGYDDDHCSTASESEFEVHHHHHHQHGAAHDAGHGHAGHSGSHAHHRDPYYTYETHTTAPAYHHGPSTDAYHAHAHPPVHPPNSCPVAPSSSPAYPPAAPDNCRIDDLQTSLESMISRMKKV
jgi:hypothetical protein